MSPFQARSKRTARWQVCLLAWGVGAWTLVAQRPSLGQEVAPPPDRVAQEQRVPPGGVPQDQAATQEQVVPLDSGPIHEAYAEPVTLAAETGVVVQQQPPEAVPELPPETRPQGDNVVWVPGYWAWADDRDDFIWISGVWRDVPPNQQWVPGYWTQVTDGYQWIRGFWTASDAEELVYLPPPPETLETEPTAPQPGPDYFWVPGTWRWRENQYYWRGGFWHPAQENWVWIPAHYRYTPRGYVYLSGYWDFPLQRRGLLFAPVYFQNPIYRRSGYFFTPNSWLDVALLTTSLFVAPRYGHYYYGNFYGPRYLNAGFYPWFDYHNRPFGYDPLFAYASWRHGGRDSDWYRNLRQEYQIRAERGPDVRDRPDVARGPRQPDLRDRPGADRDQIRLVRRIDELREARGENLTRIDEAQRREAVERAQSRFGELRRQRAEAELTGQGARPGAGRFGDGRAPGADRRDRERPQQDRRPGDRARQTRPGEGERPRADQPQRGDRPPQEQPQTERPGERRQGERPQTDRPQQGRPQTDRPQRDRPQAGQPPQRQQPRGDQRVQPRESRPGQSREGRPGADSRTESRPAGPINGRFRLPSRQERGYRGTGQPPAAGSPQQPGQRGRPQVPPRPGGVNQQPRGATQPQAPRGIQPRPDGNRGGGPTGVGPRQAPPRQAPQNRGGGGAPRGNRGQGGDDN